MNILLKLTDSKSNPMAAPPAKDADVMKLAEKMFSAYVENAKLNSPEDNGSDIETFYINTHNFEQQTSTPQAKNGELLTGVLGTAQLPPSIDMPIDLDLPPLETSRFPDVTPATAEEGSHVTLDISARASAKFGQNALELMNVHPKEHIRENPAGIVASADGLPRSTPDIINTTSQHIGALTSQTPREDTTSRSNQITPSQSDLVQPNKPTSYSTALDVTLNKISPVPVTLESLGLDIIDRSDVKRDTSTLDMSALKENLSKTVIDVPIETKPNPQATNKIIRATTEPLTLLGAVTTSAVETTLRPPQTLTAQGVTAKEAIPAQIPLQSLGLDIKGHQDVKADKVTIDVSALKESLPKTPIDVAIEIKPNTHATGHITKPAMEPLTLPGAITTSAVETPIRPTQTFAAQDVTPKKANLVEIPVQSLGSEIKGPLDIKTDKAALDISVPQKIQSQTSTDPVIEIKPDSAAVTPITKAAMEPLTLPGANTTSAVETTIRSPQTVAAQDIKPKKPKPVQIPLQSLSLDIKDRSDVKPDKAAFDISALKESLPKASNDVALEVKPNTQVAAHTTKAATEPLTLLDAITTSTVETSSRPLQTLAPQSITPNTAKAVQIPMQPLGLDIKDRPDIKTDKTAFDISALKESLPKASNDAAIEIKPNNQVVTEITKTATEPPTLLGAVTPSTVGTSTRIPPSLNVATPLPTSHPAIQAVAQNLVKVQETQSGVTVRLDPPEMGRVFIDFQFDAERNVTAIVRSEVPETSIALKDKAEFFQQILKENGFNTVTLNFQQNDTSKQNAFDQNSNAPNFSGLDAEAEEIAEVLPPVPRYELSHETAIDIKL